MNSRPKLTYVTAYVELDRSSWVNFARPFEDYFSAFKPLADLVKKSNPHEFHMVVYIDRKVSDQVTKYVSGAPNITTIQIDDETMFIKFPLWRRLNRETAIMQSEEYRTRMKHRLQFPEHTNPKYTIVNHCKVDFMAHATTIVLDSEHFCWVDFGYCNKPQNIPQRPLDVRQFDPNRITYTLISPLTELDKNIDYTLLHAPERVTGCFFFGGRNALKAYQGLYHGIHAWLQSMNIVDDDQHLVIQCYVQAPSLFDFRVHGVWHQALTIYQRTSDLTEIMNSNGSEKGGGHHNYTELYEALFETIREEKLHVLEIGIGSVNPRIPSNMSGSQGGKYRPGASLRGWRQYFPNSRIYGCDIDREILFHDDRITTFYMNQLDPHSIHEAIGSKERMYDIVIDDGLHYFPVNFAVMKQILPKLKPDGIYIIESIVQFDQQVQNDPITMLYDIKYVEIPNPRNRVDNNILIVRKKTSNNKEEVSTITRPLSAPLLSLIPTPTPTPPYPLPIIEKSTT